METIITSSCFLTLKPSSNPSTTTKSPLLLLGSHRNQSKSITVCASKNNNNNNNKKKKKKDDSHSFVPKQDESTGPFPEAVLLKEKIVEKDGEFFPEFADDDEERVYQILKLQLEDGYQMEILRHYEVVYLIHEDYAGEVEKVNEKVKAFLGEKRGKIWRMNDWGMRRLAYKIQKARNAHYILMNIEMDAKWINDFKTMLDKDERVIRHLVMKRDEAETKDCPPPPEFRSFRASMDDENGDEDEDYDDDEEYDDNENGDGIVFVDGDEDEDSNSKKIEKSKLKAQKVGR